MKTLFVAAVLSSQIFAATNFVGTTGEAGGNYFTNIQAAIDASFDGDVVLVSNGVYNSGARITPGFSLSNRIVITKNILLKSVSGATNTIIDGNGQVRAVFMTSGTIDGFTIMHGSAKATGDGIYDASGGGVFLTNNCVVSNCIVRECNASANGGGAYILNGGEIVSSLIISNNADWGGGVAVNAAGEIRNSLVLTNYSAWDGGGVHCLNGGKIISCTFSENNAARNGDGAVLWNGGSAIDSIFWNNGVGLSEIHHSGAEIAFNCIRNWLDVTSGNITNAPRFVGENNYRLKLDSPCVDAGTNMAWMYGSTDLAGSARINAEKVDMGCYELPYAHYVSKTGNNVPPFLSWEDAATNIQQAVFACSDNHIVIVSNGVYFNSDTIRITNAINLESVSGPDETIITGVSDKRRLQIFCSNVFVSGFTLTNVSLGYYDNGGGVFCENKSVIISNCRITRCSANYGGGVISGTVYNCVFQGNEAKNWGGGAFFCNAFNCKFINNRAGTYGSGAYNSQIYNSKFYNNVTPNYGAGAANSIVYNSCIASNSAYGGGGAYKSTLYNCTVVNNRAEENGGGTYDSFVYNSIVYYNKNDEGSDANIYRRFNGANEYCCSVPAASLGTGGITNEPDLLGYYQISSNSPCISAGTNGYNFGRDIDDEAWKNPPAIGCDENYPANCSGELDVEIIAERYYTYVGLPINFSINVQGKTYGNIWEFDDGKNATNKFLLSHAWNATGEYNVTVHVFNDTYPAPVGKTASLSILVMTNIHYVNKNNTTPKPPYDRWETASTSIWQALGVQLAFAEIIVTDGVYSGGFYISDNVNLKSVNGYKKTLISGENSHGIFYISGDLSNTVVEGFTLAYGYDEYVGGVGCGDDLPVISNCVIRDNETYADDSWDYQSYAGGVKNGTYINCIIKNNYNINEEDDAYGGGAHGSILINCLIENNFCSTWGDDAYGGGACYCQLYNCTVVNNGAYGDGYGGGVYKCDVYNSIVYYNYSDNNSNVFGGTLAFSCAPQDENAGTNNISGPPDFVDYSTSNYHLKAESPCVNAGSNGYVRFNFDLDYLPRIFNGTVDMGCYEFSVYPFIDVTNYPAVIEYPETTAEISGTNVNIDGELRWTNDKNPGITNSFPQGFSVIVSNLAVGENCITISGTNRYFQSTNFVVCIRRKTSIESAPQIATNALIFPCAGAQLLAPFSTNITWLVDKITDDMDGTNLVITKISVHLASNSNEVANVTNDISNLLGEIQWQVPYDLLSYSTSYVLRIEAVDSVSLTNSRIFADNEFTIIPEICYTLFLIISLLVYLARKN